MNTDYLKKRRKQKRVGQQELSKHLGVSRELMGKYENGKAVPRVDLLESWCEYLGVELRIILKN